MAKKAVKKASVKQAAKKTSTKTKAVTKAAKKTPTKTKAVKKAVMKKATKAKAKPSSPIIGEVKELVKLMVANDLSEIEIQDGQKGISLRRGSLVAAGVATPVAAPAPLAQATPAEEPATDASTENLLDVKSPMVGTFYSSPSPDSDYYVSHGSPVSDETIVCIVEAMKVMNEIKAECSGTIVEVCAKNAQPVEFGQVLYKVKPS